MDRLELSSYGVGITTLEEVFLRIGHGEENATTVEKIKQQTADLSRLSKRERELTEYTIAEDHSRSFFAQTKTLIAKRLKVAFRDRGSFFMDTVFPVFFIFFGLWISTLDLVPELPLRSMSVYEYPNGAPLIVNSANFNQTDEVLEFIERTMGPDVGPGKFFSEIRPIDVNTSDHFFNQTKTVDSYIYEVRNETGPQYG